MKKKIGMKEKNTAMSQVLEITKIIATQRELRKLP